MIYILVEDSMDCEGQDILLFASTSFEVVKNKKKVLDSKTEEYKIPCKDSEDLEKEFCKTLPPMAKLPCNKDTFPIFNLRYEAILDYRKKIINIIIEKYNITLEEAQNILYLSNRTFSIKEVESD